MKRKIVEHKRMHGRIFFRDYQMPDPESDLMISAMCDAQQALYPNCSINDLPKEVTLPRETVSRLQSMAAAYLHFVSHPAPNKMICDQLREVRNVCQYAIDLEANK